MVSLDSIEKYPFAFPVFKSHNLIKEGLYQDLKATWPDFSKFNTTNAGQVHRNNIEIKLENHNYTKINAHFKELFDAFNSLEFRQFIAQKFDLDSAGEKGFIGNFDNSELVMHVAESVDGYENPWHCDTRGRIIHFLIYFGDETILEGGQLGIAEHVELKSFLDYKQLPQLKNLKNIHYFDPENNLGIFILSQNNSYHRGCKLKGLRRFIYASYTNRNGAAWKTRNWSCHTTFAAELNSAQYRDRDGSPTRCRQIGDDLWSRSP